MIGMAMSVSGPVTVDPANTRVAVPVV